MRQGAANHVRRLSARQGHRPRPRAEPAHQRRGHRVVPRAARRRGRAGRRGDVLGRRPRGRGRRARPDLRRGARRPGERARRLQASGRTPSARPSCGATSAPSGPSGSRRTTRRPRRLVAGREEPVARIADALADVPARSVVLVGEHGVGKTALLRAALDRAASRRSCSRRSASEINAGMSTSAARGPRAGDRRPPARRTRRLGHSAAWRRRSTRPAHRSPQGLLDALMPYLEDGDS